jgi:hypothetical protein
MAYRYGFGENQLFTHHTTLLGLRRLVALKLRVGLPWMSGRWGLGLGPFPGLPHPTSVVHVLGPPLRLPRTTNKGPTALLGTPVSSNGTCHVDEKAPVSEADVSLAWAAYKEGLAALFDAHKRELLPPEVAAKGLIIKWLGDE